MRTIDKVDQAQSLVRGGFLEALHPQLGGTVGMTPVNLGEQRVGGRAMQAGGTYGT